MSESGPYRLIFSLEAFDDLDRVDRFLRGVNAFAADASNETILNAAQELTEQPELWSKWKFAGSRNIRERHIPFGNRGYIIRYGVFGSDVVILRIFHTREDRSPDD